jgi:RNA polymerase sigma-70 factor (ECF subfamily)
VTEPVRDASQLLAAARAGSSEALGQVLEAHRAYLLHIAGQELDPQLRAKGGASDLVQETFLEAQRDFASFQGVADDELRAWLRQLLRNNVANFSRAFRDTGKRAIDREVPLQPGGSSEDWVSQLAGAGSSPSAHARGAEQAQALQSALSRLPEDYCQIILLRHQEGLTFGEIGQRLGRTENAVRKLWARAVERIQQLLEDNPQ